jgi:CPA1 family monovalent cation:H+ antiporter
MEHHAIIDFVLFASVFLLGTSLLQIFANKVSFPYTVALLIVGFLSQIFAHFFGISTHITLSPDVIFFILLPLLLFEAAMHINVHQFKIQFKTISFIATFGLLVSVFVTGFGLMYFVGLPFGVSLLFGAIIASTDPIAVLSLFKTLGAPKRLALLADGESMFNDATGVITFRIISAFVVAGQAFSAQKVLGGFGSFLYVFIGSILLGLLIGYIASVLFAKVKEERVLIAALTTGLAIGSFVGAEHFFKLSGVIVTVIAGITFGNLGRAKLPARVTHFLEEFWAYFGFLAVSLVFFFASFNLDLALFSQGIGVFAIVIAVVLVARAASVYVSAFLSNRLPFFKDEPDIPMRWQHILNWGGLRGVIPLVLVYSLPDTYEYKELMLQFTMATLLFTLFVNGLTIKTLLVKLKLNLTRKEERIIEDEINIFELDEARQRLAALDRRQFDQKLLKEIDTELKDKVNMYKEELKELSTPQEFLRSLKLEAIQIERETLLDLYEQGRFTETVFHEFDSELDVQQDTIEYPEVYRIRAVDDEGHLHSVKSFRKRLMRFRRSASTYPLISKLLGISPQDLVRERYSLLRARLYTSYVVLDYLERVEKIFGKNGKKKAIHEVRKIQNTYIESNEEEINELEKQYPEIVFDYQKKSVQSLIKSAPHIHR